MKSPFPGMDPYLEPHWLDVHSKLVAYAADALNTRLPDDLIASVEERVAVESGDEDHTFGPDVRLFEPPAPETAFVEESGGLATAKYRLLAQVEPITERFIRVIRAGTERLITVVEFVSPTNKRGEGLHAFRSKRAELLASGVNFVEIDLVRAGSWKALLQPHRCPRKAVSQYRVTIRLPRDPAAVHLEPVLLRSPLPTITIPLRRKDPDVNLELQVLVDQAYENGRYARRLDYHHEPEPPLGEADASWGDALLKAAGKR
jgi:hypothetical protein